MFALITLGSVVGVIAPRALGDALDLAALVTQITAVIGDFLAYFWLIVPIALGVTFAVWGVRRLVSFAKGLAS